MFFYTNVDRYGNQILFRGYNKGERIHKKVKFEPTLFVPSQEGEWKTLDGLKVDSIQPGYMKDCKEFVEKYSDVDNFKIYGSTNYVHQFISDTFQKDIKFDRTRMNITTIDIEVASGDWKYPRNHEVKVRKKK